MFVVAQTPATAQDGAEKSLDAAENAQSGEREDPTTAQEKALDDDAMRTGYLTSILERELDWEAGTFSVLVRGSVATISLATADRDAREPQLRRLVHVPGIETIDIVESKELASGDAFTPSSGFFPRLLGLSSEDIFYPINDVFEALIADPKTTRFFASARHFDTPSDSTVGAAVGFGENFGFWKRPGRKAGDGLQVGVDAGLLAQFDLETPSADLINADYLVGIPLTWREGAHSARLRFYHQSSHLGDEFLLSTTTTRINLSFESLELLYSFDWRAMRSYIGGEYLVSREPSSLSHSGLHGGVEYRGERELFGGKLIGALDLKSWSENSGAVDAALSVGVELEVGARGRHTRWMIDLYNGYSPFGQFFDERIWFAGIGVQLGF